MTVEINGLKQVEKKIKRMEDPAKFFDDVVSDVAVNMWNELKESTPYDDLSGLEHTKNLWDFPDKLANSLYQIDNTKTSKDGKHAIANILNKGRKEVRPIRAKKLYIPISRKAKNKDKAIGAPIPDDLKYGIDYILADKSKAYKGTGFIDTAEKNSEKLMVKEIIAKVRRTFQ